MKSQKKVYKFLLVLSALIATSFLAFIIYFYLMLNFEERLTERITDDVIVINDLFSSMYLIRIDSVYIAIDTGFFESFILRGLEYNDISIDDIKYLLITHSDADHANNIDLFKSAEVYFSKEEKIMLDNGQQRFNFIPMLNNKLQIQNLNLIEDEDSIFVGDRIIKAISLPGHTEGSFGYIFDNNYLFSGDAFRLKNGRISLPFRKYFVTDEDEVRKSMYKVSGLDSIKYIFTAHSGFTADFQFAVSHIN